MQKVFVVSNTSMKKIFSEGKFDVTLPGFPYEMGHEHPLSIVTNEIVEIFYGMGFTTVEGPEVETEK